KAQTRLQKLVERSGILVFASHSTDFLARLCKTAIWIDHGSIKMMGEIEDVVRAYEGDDAARHVADNDFSDNGDERISELVTGQPIPSTYLGSRRNLGGAGGFALGMLHALAQGADWVWLADDDGRPQDSHVL